MKKVGWILEELVSEKDVAEKKRILADEYGMLMTAELEGRIQVMCNWSESIEARVFEKIIQNGSLELLSHSRSQYHSWGVIVRLPKKETLVELLKDFC